MPLSFWIFLAVCIVSFVPVIRDHGEKWKSIKKAKGKERWHEGAHLFALWFVAAFSLIGTLFLGFESIASDRKDAQRDKQYRDVTNRLGHTETNYNEATKQLQPRTITDKQINDFIFLTEHFEKFPIRIAVSKTSIEAVSYAWQVRDMLNKAKFPTPDSDTNLFLGVDILDEVTVPVFWDTNQNWGDAQLISDIGSDFRVLHFGRIEKTNGFNRFSLFDMSRSNRYAILINYFAQNGINIGAGYMPDSVLTNSCTIYINPRIR